MATNTKPRNEPPPASPAPALAPEPTSTIPPAPETSWQDIMGAMPDMTFTELRSAMEYFGDVPAEHRRAFLDTADAALKAAGERLQASKPQPAPEPAPAPEVAPPPPPGSVQAIAAEFNARKLGAAPFGGLSAGQGIVDPRGSWRAPAAPIDPALSMTLGLEERARVAQHGIGLSARPASQPVLPLSFTMSTEPPGPRGDHYWPGMNASYYSPDWHTQHQAGLGLVRQQPARQAVDVTRSVVQPPAQPAPPVDYSRGLGLTRKGGSQ